MNENQSLSHTKWNCEYHIGFVPKYGRQVIYLKLKGVIKGHYYFGYGLCRKLAQQQKNGYRTSKKVDLL